MGRLFERSLAPSWWRASSRGREARGRQLGGWAFVALIAMWVALAGQTAYALEGSPSYRVLEQAPLRTLCPEETQRVALTLENDGGRAWSPKARDRVSYHWRDAEGALVVRDGLRTDFKASVEPGASVEVAAKVSAPKTPGRYTLVWRLLREGEGWFPEDGRASVSVRVEGDGPALAWSVEPFELPELSAQGEASVEITVTNEGCATWSAETVDRLSYRWFSPDGSEKQGEGPRTPFEGEVAPGEQATVQLRLLGPKTPGKYLFRLEPIRESVAWLKAPRRGEAEVVVEVRDAALQWTWLSMDAPAKVAGGDTFEVEVELRNSGVEAWDPKRGDRLSYHWVRGGKRMRREGRRTLLPQRVEPGETVRMSVTVVAPPKPGTVQLALEPLRERVAWYGPPKASPFPGGGPSIEVEPPPFVWTMLGVRTPKVPLAGRGTEFLLTVRNDGSKAWEPKKKDRASYQILDRNGKRVARGRRTPLPRRIEPGEVVQLRVSFDTPRKPGDYQVAFGIVREHVRWFETEAEPVPLRVVRRSSLWFAGAAGLLLLWALALQREQAWARIGAWPLWTAICVTVLTELFADLAQLQIFSDGTPIALSVALAIAALVAAAPLRRQGVVAVGLVALVSLVAWVDLAYAAFFGSLAPLTAVAAVHHLADAKATVGSTLRVDHVWLALPLGSAAFVRSRLQGLARAKGRRWPWIVGLALLGAYSVVALSLAVQSTLGVKVFSEARNAQRFGYVGAHVFQAMRLVRDLGAPPLTEAERSDTFARLRAHREAAPTEARGVAKGANLVILQVEALQQWAVHAEVDGVPVMPFLSGAHEQALAYDHIYDQTLQGRTSDAEYLVLGSGHALPEGALSFLRADNEFRTLVHALTDLGYSSYSAHPYQRGFWNRSVLHPAYGFASSDFQAELGRGPKSGWGLADGPFLERFDDRLEALPEPFVAFGITLSLHHPYESFPKSLSDLKVGELKDTWIGNYLRAMRHFDRSLQAWLEDMRARGQLEHTVVLIYGDHVTGMPLEPRVAELAGESDDRYAQMRMHRVPAYIWVPGGSLHGTQSMVGGQIDLGVTALHLLGVDAPASAVGTPLVGEGPGFAALPTGGVAGPDRMLVRRGVATPPEGACVEPNEPGGLTRTDCDALEQRALEQLELARRVLDHDLYQAAEAAR